MKKILLFTLLFLFLSQRVLACSCAEVSENTYLDSCKNIYLATLLRVDLIEKDDINTYKLRGTLSEANEILKGDPQVSNYLLLKNDGSSCDSTLLVGEEYLVCGDGKEAVRVGSCTLSSPTKWNPTKDILVKLRSAK